MKNKTPLYSANTFKKSLENEDSEDGFISPADISIKDEKIWDPTDEEILSYALKLGYDIEKDPDELFEVAYYYMKYPLPEGWKRGIIKNTKELVYVNFLSGEIEVSTEIEEMAHQMYLEKKAEMNQKNVSIFKKSPEKKETTTVVPNKKIPPLNPLQKSNNSTGLKSLKNLPGIKDANTKSNKNEELQFSDKKIDLTKNNNLDIFKNENENLIKLNNNIDKFLEKSLNEKNIKDLYINNAKEKEKDKKEKNEINNNNINKNVEDIKKQNYDFLLNLGGQDEDEDEELEEEQDEEDIVTKDDNEDKDDKGEKEDKEDSFLKQMLKREKEIEQLRKEKEKNIENAVNKNENLKNLIDIKKIKDESEEILEKLEKNGKKVEKNEKNEKKMENEQKFENIELFKEKKEYLKKKLNELQEYKEEMKIKYQDKKDDYEKEKKEKQKFFDNKLKEEINNSKKKFEKQFKEKLDLYEKQLINKKTKEEKRFKDELVNNLKAKKEEDKELIKKREEKQKVKLKLKKEQLLKEIENLKKLKIKNDSNLSQKKMNMQNHILLIEEKKNLEKKNKAKKNEIEIKNIENKLEKEFQENKQKLSKNTPPVNFMPRQLNNNLEDNINSNLLNDIQKVLDEEYEMNCKAFEQELENKKLKEIDKYINLMTNEKNDQINLLKSEIMSVEKDYYKSISNIRNNCQKNKSNDENNLKIKFDQTLNGYEQTKKEIIEQNQQLMKHINDNLHKLLIGNYTLRQTETKLDEFLLNLKDTYLLVYQRNKNNFDLYENDYIFKTQFIKYLLDIINYITKLFSTVKTKKNNDNKNEENKTNLDNKNNENEDTNEQNLAENLLIYCNEKINEYRKKYKKVKNISIFKFMNGNLMKSQSFENSNIMDFDEINKTILFDASTRRKIAKNNETNDNIDKKIKINSNNENTNNDINSKDEINIQDNNNNNIPEMAYYVFEQDNNFSVPIIQENILSNLNEDILILYSDIVFFLKNEYNKIIQINKLTKENNNKTNISTNLNLIILDKIKTYTEESFSYLLLNYQKIDQHLNIKKKLRLILNHIEEYKNNFNLDKYLTKNKPKDNIEEESDIVNQKPLNNKTLGKDNFNINNYIKKNENINSNFNTKKFSSVNDTIKEKEEQKQSGIDTNLSRSLKINYNNNNNNNLNGRFDNFYRQYSSNSLVDKITNPFLYQFFNYKKNKYELDKSLGKLTMP